MCQTQLPPEIRDLPIAARLQLMEEIWESILEDSGHFRLTETQRSELDRRIAAHELDPHRSAPWDEVKKRLLDE